ncbi:hypothetical protein BGZ99_004910 [Dissophora globulifera]|uniref:Uncharacterized protein n=1 Tax=Dissophora globulifera TaxID=979702 RepID=A0A9P6RTN5_9FUNG|nr:hypothetical protein BGZ99_004910 [Dissophora globulifera]
MKKIFQSILDKNKANRSRRDSADSSRGGSIHTGTRIASMTTATTTTNEGAYSSSATGNDDDGCYYPPHHYHRRMRHYAHPGIIVDPTRNPGVGSGSGSRSEIDIRPKSRPVSTSEGSVSAYSSRSSPAAPTASNYLATVNTHQLRNSRQGTDGYDSGDACRDPLPNDLEQSEITIPSTTSLSPRPQKFGRGSPTSDKVQQPYFNNLGSNKSNLRKDQGIASRREDGIQPTHSSGRGADFGLGGSSGSSQLNTVDEWQHGTAVKKGSPCPGVASMDMTGRVESNSRLESSSKSRLPINKFIDGSVLELYDSFSSSFPSRSSTDVAGQHKEPYSRMLTATPAASTPSFGATLSTLADAAITGTSASSALTASRSSNSPPAPAQNFGHASLTSNVAAATASAVLSGYSSSKQRNSTFSNNNTRPPSVLNNTTLYSTSPASNTPVYQRNSTNRFQNDQQHQLSSASSSCSQQHSGAPSLAEFGGNRQHMNTNSSKSIKTVADNSEDYNKCQKCEQDCSTCICVQKSMTGYHYHRRQRGESRGHRRQDQQEPQAPQLPARQKTLVSEHRPDTDSSRSKLRSHIDLASSLSSSSVVEPKALKPVDLRWTKDAEEYMDSHIQQIRESSTPRTLRLEFAEHAQKYAAMMHETRKFAKMTASLEGRFSVTFEPRQPQLRSSDESGSAATYHNESGHDGDGEDRKVFKSRRHAGRARSSAPATATAAVSGSLTNPSTAMAQDLSFPPSRPSLGWHQPQQQKRASAARPNPPPRPERTSLPETLGSRSGRTRNRLSTGTEGTTVRRVQYWDPRDGQKTIRPISTPKRNSANSSLKSNSNSNSNSTGAGTHSSIHSAYSVGARPYNTTCNAALSVGQSGAWIMDPAPPPVLVIDAQGHASVSAASEGGDISSIINSNITSVPHSSQDTTHLTLRGPSTTMMAAMAIDDGSLTRSKNPRVGSSKDRAGK